MCCFIHSDCKYNTTVASPNPKKNTFEYFIFVFTNDADQSKHVMWVKTVFLITETVLIKKCINIAMTILLNL